MNTSVCNFDFAIIIVYLVAGVRLGVLAGFVHRQGERRGEGGRYLLAGNWLRWPVIGLAMFAANICTVHLVSLAEAVFEYGLVFGNFEWMAGSTVILLSFFSRRFTFSQRWPHSPILRPYSKPLALID